MGIDILSAKFLVSEARRESFGRLLTLGRQSVQMDVRAYREFVAARGGDVAREDYADDLFRALGVEAIDVLDASAYEGANLIHDLNLPIDPTWHARYDSVLDGGTLEHVFNFPVALKSCMEMVKVGGRFLGITPGNQYCGHGLYQFSPELFYGALGPANGFRIERLLFFFRGRWHSFRNPAEVKARIELLTNEPTLFFISARRVEQKQIFADWPQQSDYVESWSAAGTATSAGASKKRSFKEALLERFPILKPIQAQWRTLKRGRACSPRNAVWFPPTDLG